MSWQDRLNEMDPSLLTVLATLTQDGDPESGLPLTELMRGYRETVTEYRGDELQVDAPAFHEYLLEQLQRGGQGDVARSWVGPGTNKTISEDDLASALGGDTLATLADQTGMGRDDLLSGLSRYLPRFVDELTPDGRLPTEEEAGRWV